ncbi:protein FliT [Trinickia symbiotica]|uniref:Flagellar protein FliT n=1 Tax=Trinickia symbiotica TaxID=863227 RepID=A0A2N7X6W3_9BURK|nr:flagellar protein FliT [Trinickia symbiotica]PMS37498.1 flagellar protein FliT [Trinickia symbiotica]PPK44097.1 protein FliT [Trinickia symbiotica]
MSQEVLARAHELSRTIVAALEAGDWQIAADVSKERAPLLMSLAAGQSEENLAMIREIQAMNAVIIEKAREARDMCSSRFSEARRGIEAARLYRKTQRLR